MNPIILGIATIALLGLYFFVKSNFSKWIGMKGERFVSKKLHTLDRAHYKVLDDILLPSGGSTKTTQIDHIVVLSYGIFCIETKSHSGWIFGTANDKYWTQVFYKYRNKFYNPLHQNYAHTEALRSLLSQNYPQAPVYSFVVFPYAGKLKIAGTNAVGTTRETIQKIQSYATVFVVDDVLLKIYAVICDANITDKEQRKNHDRDVARRKSI